MSAPYYDGGGRAPSPPIQAYAVSPQDSRGYAQTASAHQQPLYPQQQEYMTPQGYSQPSQNNSPPVQGYGPPPQSYGRFQQDYRPPPQAYAPQGYGPQAYGQPSQGYGPPPSLHYSSAPPPQGQACQGQMYGDPPPNASHATGDPYSKQPDVSTSIAPVTQGPQAQPYSGRMQYRDVWAALLFVVHVGIIGYLAFAPGIHALNKSAAAGHKKDPNHPDQVGDESMVQAFAGIAVVLAAGVAWSGIWISALRKCADSIIRAAIFGSIGTAAIGCLIAFFCHIYVLAGLCGLAAVLHAVWYYCVRHRIPFASMNLKCSALATMQYYGTQVVAAACTLLQVVWTLLWALALYGVAAQKGAQVVLIDGVGYAPDQCTPINPAQTLCECTVNGTTASVAGPCTDHMGNTSKMAGSVVFVLLISLFWGSLVAKNLLFCSVSGAVADWWFDGRGKNVTCRSFKRACTTSFGSICFGCLLVATIKALKETVKIVERQSQEEGEGGSALMCLLVIFNRYAFVYCSVYGDSFVASGRKVWNLFASYGFTAIINDDLAETALMLVCLVVGLLTGVVGYLYCVATGIAATWGLIVTLIGFVAGFFIAHIIMSVLDAGVATIFVCFAQNPGAFRNSHPQLYDELVQAWSTIGYDVPSGKLNYVRPGQNR